MTDPRILEARADVARHWDAVADRTDAMAATLRRVAAVARAEQDVMAEVAAAEAHREAVYAHDVAYEVAIQAERRLHSIIAAVYRERAQ